MFSIIIPTFNNLDYLKLCIKSIRQNSKYTHQIIPHVNIGEDGTCDFLKDENLNKKWITLFQKKLENKNLLQSYEKHFHTYYFQLSST